MQKKSAFYRFDDLVGKVLNGRTRRVRKKNTLVLGLCCLSRDHFALLLLKVPFARIFEEKSKMLESKDAKESGVQLLFKGMVPFG